MFKLALISHFYNNTARVIDQISKINDHATRLSNVEFILVDDCSEELLIPNMSCHFKYYRVDTEIEWNQAGARNLGMFASSAEWLLFFDIDQSFSENAINKITESLRLLDPNTMYFFKILELSNNGKALPCHPNTFLVNSSVFKEKGIYDEDFCGYYGYEDIYLTKAWQARGGKVVLINDIPYFEQENFKTETMNRDSSRNLSLAESKMRNGFPQSTSLLRFSWHRVE